MYYLLFQKLGGAKAPLAPPPVCSHADTTVAKSAILVQQLAVNWTQIRMRCFVASRLRVLKAHNPL